MKEENVNVAGVLRIVAQAMAFSTEERELLTQLIQQNKHRPQFSDRISHLRFIGADQLFSLTPREYEVVTLIIAGAQNKEIARRLDISPRTVEIHRSRAGQKWGTRNTAELVRVALELGIQPSQL